MTEQEKINRVDLINQEHRTIASIMAKSPMNKEAGKLLIIELEKMKQVREQWIKDDFSQLSIIVSGNTIVLEITNHSPDNEALEEIFKLAMQLNLHKDAIKNITFFIERINLQVYGSNADEAHV